MISRTASSGPSPPGSGRARAEARSSPDRPRRSRRVSIGEARVPAWPALPPLDSPPRPCATPLGWAAMSASSHQAELSSLRSQLEELRARVEKIALTYQGTPDSAVAAELFEADRALTTAGRVIDRALTALSELAASQ